MATAQIGSSSYLHPKKRKSSRHPKRKGPKGALLPGVGRPLNYIPNKTDPDYVGDLFKNALSIGDIGIYEERRSLALSEPNYGPSVRQNTLTLRELEMLRFMNSVTDKPDWFDKVNDEGIVKKWKNEVCGNSKLDFTPKMADCCIDELRHIGSIYSASPENPPPVFVFNGDVVKSDTAVSSTLKQALQEEVKSFEAAIPKRDWHPGSDEKVLDLVHPSLFPLVYGTTRILPKGETTTLSNCIERCGEGDTVPLPRDETREFIKDDYLSLAKRTRIFSKKFQWLPCEVDISQGAAKITSYINNLHPQKEVRLYELIEKLIDASIPLWNVSLAPLADESFVRYPRIPYTAVEYDPDPEWWPESEQIQRRPDEVNEAFWERKDQWIKATRRLVFPEPDDFDPLPQPDPFDPKATYGKRGLQVIVKLANIHLTPEKPEYEGGTWHVEGQMNEHIVATSLYYFSSENITTSALSFRQLCEWNGLEASVDYVQFDDEWLMHIFGCENNKAAIQHLGSVETREGRLLTFPNILLHRVEPFKLADPTQSGHRKIVALFLVDPNIKITSTAHVPCQQQEWWWDAVMSTKSQSTSKAAVSGIPIELQDAILEEVDFPFHLKEAKALRLNLMEERKDFTLRHGDVLLERATFSLCEH